jgi:hypothetical protein
MEILKIFMSRLFHTEFLDLFKKAKAIIANFNPPNTAIKLKADAAFGQIPDLEASLNNDSGSLFTEAMQTADHKRDDLVTGLKEVVSGHCKNPDPLFSQPAILLFHVIDGYGVIASANPSSETTLIDALVHDLLNKPENLAPLNALGLKKWVEALQTANNDYKTQELARINEKANDTTQSFTELRSKATKDFDALTKTINSLAWMDNNAGTFDNLINEMNTMLDEFNQKIAIRKGIKAAKKQKKDEPK